MVALSTTLIAAKMSDIDDTSSVMALSEAATDTASQPSTLNTRFAAAGSTAFAAFRGGRSVADQLQDIDTNGIPTEVSLMRKIKIQHADYVPTEWLHRKKRGRKSPIDPYGRRLTKVVHGLRGWRLISYPYPRRHASVRGSSASPSSLLAHSDTLSKM